MLQIFYDVSNQSTPDDFGDIKLCHQIIILFNVSWCTFIYGENNVKQYIKILENFMKFWQAYIYIYIYRNRPPYVKFTLLFW